MKKFITIISIICLILVGLIVREVYEVTGGKTDWDIELIGEYDCDLQSSECEFPFKDEIVKIKVKDTPILINTKHTVTVDLKQMKVDEVWIDFKGIELDMGHNRLKLKYNGSQFVGKFFLPSCSLKIMTWHAMVIVKSGDKMQGYVYKFKTVKNNE